MPRILNDLLIRYCRWVNIEKRERRLNNGEKHNLNAGNLTDCDDITISDYTSDWFIATAVDAVNFEDCDDNVTGVLITAVNAGDSTDCANILVWVDEGYELITTDVYTVNSMDCADNAAVGLIAAIDALYLADCTDL